MVCLPDAIQENVVTRRTAYTLAYASRGLGEDDGTELRCLLDITGKVEACHRGSIISRRW